MSALKLQAVTERKFEELNKFKASAEEQLLSLRTELKELKVVTVQEMAELRQEFQKLKQNVERQMQELTVLREKLEQREEQEEPTGEHSEFQSKEDLHASTSHKRPLLKKIRGMFRTTRSMQKRKKKNKSFDDLTNGNDGNTMAEDARTSYVSRRSSERSQISYEAEESRTGRRDVSRHDSTRSQISCIDEDETMTNRRVVNRHESARSQISLDAYDARTGRHDVRRHHSTRSQISLDAYDARTGRRDVRRHDSTRSQISFGHISVLHC